MPIHILPPEIASQIAAGEVIERPASVVKELIENSLDAGASQISIRIKNAGHSLIELSDDGSGIPKEEIALAVARHATSKLETAQDLMGIKTLGFRGEALASIGSVSRLTITSRVADYETGMRLRVDAGREETPEPIGAPPGTLIRVEELFYNVPARRKFLKHESTERRYIDDLVTRYAVAYPEVRFHLEQEGRQSLQTSGNGSQREVLGALYGVDAARQMMEVNFRDEDFTLTGFVSPTNLSRTNRKDILFFVNRRPVQDAMLTSAVIKAYHTLLMVGRFPMTVLFLELPPEVIDVNVHPTKAEVRFSNPGEIFSNIQRIIRRVIALQTPVPGIEWEKTWSPYPFPAAGETIHPIQRQEYSDDVEQLSIQGIQQEGQQLHSQHLPRVPLLRLVGQIASTYLVAEGPDGLYLIDQHAAHERVLFEKYLSLEHKKGFSQSLLQPATVEVSPAPARLLEDQLQILEKLGFLVEIFGGNTFLIRTIPAFLLGMEPSSILHSLVEDFEEDETPLQSIIEHKIMARICKRAAIKAGQVLSREEQHSLLQDLEKCHSPRTCPHGRPTMIHLSVDLLERQFGRKGAR